jgi:hypothetical protein
MIHTNKSVLNDFKQTTIAFIKDLPSLFSLCRRRCRKPTLERPPFHLFERDYIDPIFDRYLGQGKVEKEMTWAGLRTLRIVFFSCGGERVHF